MNKSLVSVVIPVFNEEANLEALVSRCAAAGGKLERPFEIILVDDGSSDRSAAKIEAAAASGDQPGACPAGGGAAPADDVVDAEFTEVKDDKK